MNFDMFGGFQGSLPGMIYDQIANRRRRRARNPVPTRPAVGRGADLIC